MRYVNIYLMQKTIQKAVEVTFKDFLIGLLWKKF